VTAVVAAAADDGDPAGELVEHEVGDGAAGALHQLLERSSVRLLRVPRLLGCQQRDHDSTTTATAAASPRDWVMLPSIRAAPSRSAASAVRPESCTPGFGRPAISISFQVKWTPVPSALPTASFAANRPA